MPPVLIPVLVAAGASTAAATVGAYAITIGASIALSIALRPDDKKAQAEQRDPAQIQRRQAIPSRIRGYGEDMLAGAVIFFGESAGVFYEVFYHCEGPIEGFVANWLNDVDGQTDASGFATVEPWGSFVRVLNYEGGTGQLASTPLVNAFPGQWTTNHRLRGCAYSVLRCAAVQEQNFQKVFPTGVPGLRVRVKQSKVYDGRDATQNPASEATWKYSDLAGPCIADHLTYKRGFRIPRSYLNQASFDAHANLCNQNVPLKGGGTEKRYRIGGTYELTEEHRETQAKLLATCEGELYLVPDGTIGIRGGAWEEPTVTLTDADIISYTYVQENDALSEFNRLKISYKSPLHDFQIIETEAWDDLAAQDAAGEIIEKPFTLSMVPSHGQARRLAKIEAHKNNPRHRLEIVARPRALLTIGQRTVHLKLDELGIDEPFLIRSSTIPPDLKAIPMTITSFGPEAYAWNPATEEGTPPPVPGAINVSVVPPVPTGAVLSIVRTQVQSGTYAVKVRATVNALTGDNARFVTIGRFRKTGDPDWIDMAEDGAWKVISGLLDDGAQYEVQVAHAGWGGKNSRAVSAWVPAGTITASSDPVAPGPMTNLATTVSGTTVTINARTPASANFRAWRLYRGTTNVAGAAVLVGGDRVAGPNVAVTATDPGRPAATTYYYWVDAVNASGLASAKTGPSTIAVP